MNNKKVIDLVNGLIDMWEEDTMFLSSPCYDHPAFTIMVKMGKKDWCHELVVKTVLERMTKDLTLFYGVLYDIVTEEKQPEIPDSLRGNIQEQTDIWLQWGRDNGYLDK